MDGDGGGMGGMDVGGGEGVDADGGAGTDRTDGGPADSGAAVLQSMGYVDRGAGMDRVDEESTSSWTSGLKSITAALIVPLGLFVAFLILMFLFG